METRNISLTLEEAKEWYNSNIVLRDIALKAFTKEELECSFNDIKTFADACNVLDISFDANSRIADIIASTSKASAAMFKLNIISKALNLGQNLNFAKRSKLYYPCISLVSEISFYLRKKINSNEMQHIGIVESEGKEYHVISGSAFYDYTTNGVFLGCATKEIAQHFSKYFGMLIMEARYDDLPDFIITLRRY